jgi:uncharacterized alkaline shock family protein YloU
MEEGPTIGKITIDPGVLETIARLTALAVPGVVRLTPPGGLQRLLKKENGVEIVIEGDSVRVDLYVVAAAGKNLLVLGRQVQSEVTRAIHDIVGMRVEAVNVHVEDVAPEPNP